MKNAVLFSLFALCFSLNGLGQSCLPGGITFTSQAQIDNFKNEYPGCKVVGQVIINGTGIYNLDGLNEITTISYGFELMNNNSLTNLNGLQSLDSVGNQFVISQNNNLSDISGLHNLRGVYELDLWSNAALPNLDGLGKLSSITNILSIGSNPSLTNIQGLQQLDSIGGLEIRDNKKLNSLQGLESLRFVGNARAVTGAGLQVSLSIQDNPLLTNLSGLDNLNTVVGGLLISGNPNLSSLQGLGNLSSAGGLGVAYTNYLTDLNGLDKLSGLGNKWVSPYGGALYLVENWGLTNLQGLEKLDSVGGKIIVESNRELASLNGFQVRHAGGLSIAGNDKLPGLAGLESLEEIDSALILSGLLFADLTGLSNLKRVGDFFYLSGNPNLTSLAGLNSLNSVATLNISFNEKLASLNGFPPLQTIGALEISYSPALSDFKGLETLQSISRYLNCTKNPSLNSLSGLEQLGYIGGDLEIVENPVLTSLQGLGNLKAVGQNLRVYQNTALTNLDGLNQLDSIGGFLLISNDSALTSLQGLENLRWVDKEFFIVRNPALSSLQGLGNLREIGSNGSPVYIEENHALKNLEGLDRLSAVPGELNIRNNASLLNLEGLNHLKSVQYYLRIEDNPALQTLNGLDSLVKIDFWSLEISNNDVLSDLSGLRSLNQVGGFYIQGNASLADCAVFPVCNQILNQPTSVSIFNNATGCNSAAEVEAQCNSIPVLVEVRWDSNGNCLPDAGDGPVPDVLVRLAGTAQTTLRASDATGLARFGYLESGAFSVSLPQFPSGAWSVCQQPVLLDPMGSSDTIRATLLLSPAVQCPELEVQLGLPSHFRGCLVESPVSVSVRNSGTALAEGVKAALLLPAGLELVSAQPPVSATLGDTLYFDLPDLAPFAAMAINLLVKTSCDVFLFEQTLCVTAVATLNNACPSTLPAFSEIKATVACDGDSLRFTLKNIGDAPTQAPHTYVVFRNDTQTGGGGFALNSQQSLEVAVPADGATWRLEATKLDDGTRTATALENCGGLTPGWITAFWLDQGPLAYALDCRMVIGAFDPNQKTALPTGLGAEHLLPANRPLQYTIDFQNTGTDTAFRVLLRDDLDEDLDLNTFRPGFASHPYAWEIRGNRLEVLFQPIALPDSNVNEPASHGFFSYEIAQQADLPDGTLLENTADIIFDFNPPVVTNTVRHTIGQLIVSVDAPQGQPGLWQVWSNPTRAAARFVANEWIGGEKQLVLYGTAGQVVRQAQFSGQVFDFQRGALAGGLYFFTIRDAKGRVFSGKIILE
ncbi:MAG: hypothetical protein IT260_18065 [Saprospiraceae bacterium]|nr:hypothetical protein [Saprospiraceae bacterium]